jgi:hypothetical protein
VPECAAQVVIGWLILLFAFHPFVIALLLPTGIWFSPLHFVLCWCLAWLVCYRLPRWLMLNCYLRRHGARSWSWRETEGELPWWDPWQAAAHEPTIWERLDSFRFFAVTVLPVLVGLYLLFAFVAAGLF